MNLCIDIGNTSTKAALFNNGELHQLIIDLKAPELNDILKKYEPKTLACKSGSNLAVETLLKPDQYLSHLTNTPLKLDYNSPETLGMDRLAACVACHDEFPDETILKIDLGTCLTIDLIEKNVFRGGLIAPGLEMRLKAMNEFTAALPRVPLSDSVSFPGKTTTESMQVGVYQSIMNEIRGYIYELSKGHKNLHVVDCSRYPINFAKDLKNQIFARPNSTLVGLNCIIQHNA